MLKKNRRRHLNISLLAGCTIAICWHLVSVILPFEGDVVRPAPHFFQPAEKQQLEREGLFGLSLEKETATYRCGHAQWRLTGIVRGPDVPLFIIEGKTGLRFYHPGDLIDGKYPVVTFNASRILIREAGHYTLLCLSRETDSGISTSAGLKQKPLKSINTPYFSLKPVSIPELSVIGYHIDHCDYRCKVALTTVGLRTDDTLLAIDGMSFSDDMWNRLQQNLKGNSSIVLTVKRQGQPDKLDIIIAAKSHLRELLSNVANGDR